MSLWSQGPKILNIYVVSQLEFSKHMSILPMTDSDSLNQLCASTLETSIECLRHETIILFSYETNSRLFQYLSFNFLRTVNDKADIDNHFFHGIKSYGGHKYTWIFFSWSVIIMFILFSLKFFILLHGHYEEGEYNILEFYF